MNNWRNRRSPPCITRRARRGLGASPTLRRCARWPTRMCPGRKSERRWVDLARCSRRFFYRRAHLRAHAHHDAHRSSPLFTPPTRYTRIHPRRRVSTPTPTTASRRGSAATASRKSAGWSRVFFSLSVITFYLTFLLNNSLKLRVLTYDSAIDAAESLSHRLTLLLMYEKI